MSVRFLLLLCALPGAAWANASHDPADPKHGGGALVFDSGLRPSAKEAEVDPTAHWRAHNDRVREVGGHVGLLRSTRGAPAKPATPAHGGHR